MIKYETPKGIVSVDLDKHRRPVFMLPAGMHGDIWDAERDNLHQRLKADFPNIVLPKPRVR